MPVGSMDLKGALKKMEKPAVAKKEKINCKISSTYITPFIYRLSTIPTPKAMARAEKIASIPLDKPARESPDIVSLMEFVMDTPGTRHMMAPIIIISRE